VLCTGTPILSPERQDIQLRLALTDITDQKQTEIHLETQRQELRMSYQLLEQAHAKLLETRNDERRRMARELHDDQCQQVSVLILKTSAMERQADPLLAKQLRLLRVEQTRLLGSLRDLSHGLHAEIGGVRILRRLIRRYATRVQRRMALTIDLQLGRFEDGVTDEGCTCLFRIVQEGLHNIIRHAEASRVVIGLNKEEGHITRSISDDGKGFNPNSVETAYGFGLLGMEERLDRLKGQLLIENPPGVGTRLTAVLPVSEPSR
jgi:signal transduction histidine kinase